MTEGAARVIRRGLLAGGVVLLAVLGASLPLHADSWAGPWPFTVFSESARFFVRFIPGKSLGDTYGFSTAAKGPHGTALLYALQQDRSYRLVREVTLPNPIAPVDAVVSDTGHFLTFDNWHNLGYGKIVGIYGPSGERIRSYDLEELYPPASLAKIPVSTSSRHWRCRPWGFVGPGGQTEVYVHEILGGVFVFDLSSGAFRYAPGTNRDCPPPNGPVSWTKIGP